MPSKKLNQIEQLFQIPAPDHEQQLLTNSTTTGHPNEWLQPHGLEHVQHYLYPERWRPNSSLGWSQNIEPFNIVRSSSAPSPWHGGDYDYLASPIANDYRTDSRLSMLRIDDLSESPSEKLSAGPGRHNYEPPRKRKSNYVGLPKMPHEAFRMVTSENGIHVFECTFQNCRKSIAILI